MISVDEARALVLALADAPRPETVPLDQAAGRVMVANAVSNMTQPPFDSAAMDGYALRHADVMNELIVIGEAAAGHPWVGQADSGTAVRIFTGAEVPAGYDRVVMQEHADRNGNRLRVNDPDGTVNIRIKGSDFARGDQFGPKRRLTPHDVGLLAAMNVGEVTVARRPRVAILATGDELVRPGDTPRPGQIICSNDLSVAALARDAGAEVEILPIARDTLTALRDRFERAAEFDLFITIGGASVGDHDLIGQITEDFGMARSFYKIAMRPGKPLMAGKIGTTAMLGLPGNPVSSIVCAILFMQPLLMAMQGGEDHRAPRYARLATDLDAEGPRQHYLRAQLTTGDDLPLITPFADQDSAQLSIMSQADALLIRKAGDPAKAAGTLVEYLPLR